MKPQISKKMFFSAIVAMGENRVIGDDNTLPWHLPADLQHFKKITLGHPILMGRKTYTSIGRPLPKRTNIILTRNPKLAAPGCIVITSLDKLADHAELATTEEIFVIGGAEIYQQLLAKIQRIYMTIVHDEFGGDTYFPELDMKKWKQTSREFHEADEENEYDYSFLRLERLG